MCGIIGVYSENYYQQKEKLNIALNQIAHRGPDCQSLWVSQTQPIALGHVRLSIIDVRNGMQPVFNATKKIYAVVNGEFYDYEQIRQDLIAEGFQFTTNSDSEILVHLYEKYGVKCLQYLRGEFAFILWDEENQILFAARDRFGIKPIYYSCKDNGDLYLASEAKAIFPFDVKAEWDEESFYHSLYLRVPLQNRSLFKGIKQIPPGHYLLKKKMQTKASINKYWDFNYPQVSHVGFSDEQQYIAEFRRLLTESIALRLKADVPLAFYLSGGIDSSVILSVAAEMSTKELDAFTLQFEHADYDEYAFAKETADKLGVRLNTLRITEKDLVDNFAKAVWHSENLFNNGNGISKFLLSQYVQKNGYKVILTGEGSDEVLGGYVHFKQDVIESQFPKDKSHLQNIYNKNKLSLGFFLSTTKSNSAQSIANALGFVPGWVNNHACNGDNISQLLADNYLEKFRGQDPYAYYIAQLDIQQLKERSTLSKSLYTWSKQILPNYILSVLGDRMEMAHSIEGRVPFLDHRFVEFLTQLPDDLKIKNSVEKYILREAFKHTLTPNIYKRQKHSFLAPPSIYREDGPLYHFVQDTLRSKRHEIPFLCSNKITAELDKINALPLNEKLKYDPLLMFLTSMFVFQQCFIKA